MSKTVSILAMCAILLASSSIADETISITGPLNLQDADTFEIGPVLIRVHGVDAPEIGQNCQSADGGTWPCGEIALARMKELVEPGGMDCDPLSRDQYGRIISVCFVDGVDVGRVLVEEGLVWAYVAYAEDYVDVEAMAKSQGIGIWQAPTQAPWLWREDVWKRAVELHGECPIKGNVSASGEQIYHTPFSPYYDRIDMNADSDRRWFCDEAEALAAGWRAPHR